MLILGLALFLLKTPVSAAEAGGSDSSNPGTGEGGSTPGGVIYAGVQFGTPPSSWESSDGNGCTWRPADPYDSQLGHSGPVEKTLNGIRYRLFDRACPSGWSSVWVPQITGEELGEQGANSIYGLLPAPAPGMAPPPSEGIVNVGAWIWTGTSSWRNYSVTAWVPTPTGIIWARTTARPVALRFSPGDGSFGSGPIACDGPGPQWHALLGDDTPSPCMYTYQHSSVVDPTGRFAATLSIEWAVTWQSNVGSGGSLTGATTTTALPITVREIQALVSK